MRVILSIFLCLLAFSAVAELATAQIQSETIPDELILDGRVEAVQQSTVSAQVSGRITEILFDVDDYVEKDQVILRFHDTEQQARLKQAQASQQEARARLKEARAEHDRISKVYQKKLVAKAAMDKANANLKAANARATAATAAVTAAQEQLEHTVVRAPYSGILTKRHVEMGETARIGQPLASGLSLEVLRAVVDVPQRYVSKVRESGKARILYDGKRLDSTGMVVFPYADEKTHTFRARVDFAAGQADLYPGMFIKVAFITGKREALLAPEQAVVRRSEVTAVYVQDPDGKIRFRHVRTGMMVNDRIEILSGVAAGDQLVLDPHQAGVLLKQQKQ